MWTINKKMLVCPSKSITGEIQKSGKHRAEKEGARNPNQLSLAEDHSPMRHPDKAGQREFVHPQLKSAP